MKAIKNLLSAHLQLIQKVSASSVESLGTLKETAGMDLKEIKAEVLKTTEAEEFKGAQEVSAVHLEAEAEVLFNEDVAKGEVEVSNRHRRPASSIRSVLKNPGQPK